MKERKLYEFWKYGIFWAMIAINIVLIQIIWGIRYFEIAFINFEYVMANVFTLVVFLVTSFSVKKTNVELKRRAKEGIPPDMSFAEADNMRHEMENMTEDEKIAYVEKRSEEHYATKAKTPTQTSIMQCPKCQSDDIFVMGENRKSFSVKKAVAGTVLTGGIGAIAGFAGKKNGYDCFCGDCKHRFLLKDK